MYRVIVLAAAGIVGVGVAVVAAFAMQVPSACDEGNCPCCVELDD